MNTETTALTKKIVDEETLTAFLATLPSQLTNGEKTHFIQVAASLNLNPWKREIHCVAYGSGEYRQFSLITGYEVYLKRASRINKLKGWKTSTTGTLEPTTFKTKRKQKDGTWKDIESPGWKGDLVAHIEIKIDGWDEPFTWEVEFNEYNQKNSMWNDKPKTMIKKVVIGQGFRMAFPDEFDGFPYMSEEVREFIDITPEEKIPEKVDIIRTKIIETLATYTGDDKEVIRAMCNEKAKAGEFTETFATEIATQLKIQL